MIYEDAKWTQLKKSRRERQRRGFLSLRLTTITRRIRAASGHISAAPRVPELASIEHHGCSARQTAGSAMTAVIQPPPPAGRESWPAALEETSPTAAAGVVSAGVDRHARGGGNSRRWTQPGTVSWPFIGQASN